MRSSKASWVVLAGCAALTVPQGSAAQETAAERARMAMDEIVVTARRREERLQDVPVSASVLSGQELERYNTVTLSEIGTQIPNVNFVAVGSGSGGMLQIRGLGSTSGDAGIEQSVLINFDGVPLSRGGRITRFAFFDLESVEVLKGPQALFFGKNSPAGVVSARSRGPGAERELAVTAGHEFESQEWFGQIVASGPISDSVGARLALRGEKLRGWMRNVAEPQANPLQPDLPLPGNTSGKYRPGSETLAGRLTLDYQPTEAFSATLKLFGVDYEDNGEHLAWSRVRCADGQTLPTTSGVPDPQGDCRKNMRTALTSQPEAVGSAWPDANQGVPYSELQAWVSAIELQYQLPHALITSVTGFWGLDSRTYDTSDASSLGILSGVNNEKGDGFTQELRINSDLEGAFDYQAGLFFERMDRNWYNTGRIAPLPADPFSGKFHSWEQRSKVDAETLSLYAQLIWNLSPTVEVTGGARYTAVTTDVVLRNTYVHAFFPPGIFLPVGDSVVARRKDDDVSPEFTISWRPDDRAMFYAAYKTGYKAGGFSTPGLLGADRDENTSQFDSESAQGFEFGTKFTLLDARLTGSATLFRYDFDDLQLTQFDAQTTSFFIRNAAKMRSEGVELDGSFWLTPSLAIRAAGSYNDAAYRDFAGAPCFAGQTAQEGCVSGVQDLTGRRPPSSSRWEWQAGALLETDLSRGWRLAATIDARWRGSYQGTITNMPWAKQGSLMLLDASLAISSHDDKWAWSLFGRNLTDKLWMPGADTPAGGQRGELVGTIQRPREIGLQMTLRL
ncbi:MAG: TonB-dependent receptor [Gammaproteobacteria bacterium]|nr:TonB-dependent receptor [Gammaproteobacteria bacterium]